MKLPNHVSTCIAALEDAGYSAYAVGGCVRDWLLGLAPQDFDLCTCARPEQIQQVFQGRDMVLSGLKHGTVGIIFDKEVVEITTYRTEGSYSDNRHPDWVRFVDAVEADLARRDFTVNAMAWSPTRGLQDPFGGAQDLKDRVLRAVGEPERRFREDALRILRGARFAAKYRLTPEKTTYAAMQTLAPLMENLARERVYSELCKLLIVAQTEDILHYGFVITQVIPELAPAVDFDQRCRYHAYDLFTHIAHVTAGVRPDLTLRWAALLHDVGKVPCFHLDEQGQGHFYGHASVSAQMAETILLRLKAPTALRQEVVELIRQHMTYLEPDRQLLRRRLSRLGQHRLELLLELQSADMGSKGTGKEEATTHSQALWQLLAQLLKEDACLTLRDLAINGKDLMALGFPAGKLLGQCLNALLEAVVDEQLPNERQPLLAAAQEYRKSRKE